MIEAIAALDRSEGSVVLAKAAQLLLATAPDGDVEISHRHLAETDLPARVVLELSRRVQRPSDSPEQRFQRLAEELSREMSAWALGGSSLEEIRNRAGEKGTLTAGLYTVTVSPHFKQVKDFLCVKEVYAERAIRNATAVEHLNIGDPDAVGFSVSLFVQTPRLQGPPYTLLVRCNRSGSSLSIEDAFYLFHDTFRLKNTKPSRLLYLLLERFGRPVKIGDTIGNSIEHLSLKYPDTGKIIGHDLPKTHEVAWTGSPKH
jgi:hypothetical protein